MDINKLKELHGEVSHRAKRDTYYMYLSYLVRELRPRQIVELGTAQGIADVVMMVFASPATHIYTIDIKNHSELLPNHPNIHRFVGDDLDLSSWGDTDLSKTDLWFIDSEHSDEHVKKTVELYKPFWKPGSVLVFDDINMYKAVWNWIPFTKLDISDIHEPGGFGIVTI